MAGYTQKMSGALVAYAETGNKTGSYRTAYECSNMQPQTIERKAMELFAHPLMAEAVKQIDAARQAEVDKAAKEAGINAGWVLKRAALLADFNINKFIRTVHGKAYYDFTDATDDDWYCISEYTLEQDLRVAGEGGELELISVDKIKLKGVDKLRALEIVGKHVDVQAFREQLAVQGALVNMSLDEFRHARREVLEHDDC